MPLSPDQRLPILRVNIDSDGRLEALARRELSPGETGDDYCEAVEAD